MTGGEQNRRKCERIAINTPATIAIEGTDRIMRLHTRDLSSDGGFFCTSEPLQYGVKVKIHIVMTNKTIAKLTGTQFQLQVCGTVVRSDPAGMAVCFTGHKIIPFKKIKEKHRNETDGFSNNKQVSKTGRN